MAAAGPLVPSERRYHASVLDFASGSLSSRAANTRLGGDREPQLDVEFRFQHTFTAAVAPTFCHAVRRELKKGARSFVFDLQRVRHVDAVGLAALLQAQQVAAQASVGCSVRVNETLRRAVIEAKLVEELPAAHPQFEVSSVVQIPAVAGEERPPVIVRAPGIALRQAGDDDGPLFHSWAEDPYLDQMVGSRLLYQCRHLAAGDPEVTSAILYEPCALTLVVDTGGEPSAPRGFVHLYGIDLSEQLAFLETVITDPRSLRTGVGIQASRLLLAYAQDTLAIRRVETKVYAYNVLSINALRRNGFQLEGVLREARLYDGQRWDILIFGILDSEMRTQRERDAFPYLGLWS